MADEKNPDLAELGELLMRFGKGLIAVGSKLAGKQSTTKAQGALWQEQGRPQEEPCWCHQECGETSKLRIFCRGQHPYRCDQHQGGKA